MKMSDLDVADNPTKCLSSPAEQIQKIASSMDVSICFLKVLDGSVEEGGG